MTDHPNTLALTDTDRLGERCYEIVRLWVAREGSTAFIATHYLPEPRAFGQLVADLLRHGVDAYAGQADRSTDEARAAIVEGFQAAMASDHLVAMAPLQSRRDEA